MSLKTRLAMLAASALLALIVAAFVAWRLARMTETFILRQAESSTSAAARDLAREIRLHPNGYFTLADATQQAPDSSAERNERERPRRPRPTPPHVTQLFNAYANPLARLTAITLHPYAETTGGFYRLQDNSLMHVTPEAGNLSGAEQEALLAIARQAAETDAPASRILRSGGDSLVLAAYPARVEDEAGGDTEVSRTQAGGIAATWAVRRLKNLSGASDWPNLIALIALALVVVAVTGLSLLTVRDLQGGVRSIEDGLSELESDLSRTLRPQQTPELSRIADAINDLSATLRRNLARQRELEHDLRRSEKLSALGRLVAGVAHEVRNPLSAIKLKIQLARRGGYPSEKLEKTFSVVAEEIERLDLLVSRLLELARPAHLDAKEFDLAELIQSRAAIFQDLAARSGVEVITMASSAVRIEGDERRLGQVLDNLIRNALEAMPGGGRLSLRCEAIDSSDGAQTARIIIADTGGGIAPDEREHIFEPFYTSREKGTGLGLAIAREIVEAHGGRITFESGAGGGASFQIELPRQSPSESRGSISQSEHRGNA